MHGPLNLKFVYNYIQNTLRSGVKQMSKADNVCRVFPFLFPNPPPTLPLYEPPMSFFFVFR